MQALETGAEISSVEQQQLADAPRWRLVLAQFVAAAHEEGLAASVRAERDGVGGVGGGECVEGRRGGVGVGRRREVV